MEWIIISMLMWFIIFVVFNTTRKRYLILNKNLKNSMIQVEVHISCANNIIVKALENIKYENYETYKYFYEIIISNEIPDESQLSSQILANQWCVIENVMREMVALSSKQRLILGIDEEWKSCNNMIYTSVLIYNESLLQCKSYRRTFPANIFLGLISCEKESYINVNEFIFELKEGEKVNEEKIN